MYSLPKTVTVNDREYAIRNGGDFRIVLDCFEALNDIELEESERCVACLYIFYDFEEIENILSIPHEDLQELVNEMFKFFRCGENDNIVATTQYKTIDWKEDSQLICSAINAVANTEVRALDYLHWWTFMGYFSAIGESPLSTVVGIRSKIAKGKKLEKYENEFRRNNPQYFNWDFRTQQQKEDDELIKKLWNNGGEEA